MGMSDETALLKKMGLDVEMPEPGCCGMAGSFGFEHGRHFDVAMACGERALLPAVRQADYDTLIVANGFSCQQQIGQGTGRRPQHLAEILQLALHQQNGASSLPPPAETNHSPRPSAAGNKTGMFLVAGAALALTGWLVYRNNRG